MSMMEALAEQQPEYYDTYIKNPVKFYLKQPENYFNVHRSKFNKMRRNRQLRLPFPNLILYYKDLAVVRLKDLPPDDGRLDGTPFAELGCIIANIVFDINGKVQLFPVALALHREENIIMPISADNSFDTKDLAENVKEQMDQLAKAVCYTILTLTESWTEYVEEPVRLNKKRVDKGKAPIREYHILHLGKKTKVSINSGGGSHASPAFHLRRGHFRRYRDGRVVWVRDTTVGKKSDGIIMKDYAL